MFANRLIAGVIRHALLAALALPACGGIAPLFCDENTPCTDPDRPFCDLTGEFPESEGHGRTCIADPFDAGPGDDAGSDGGVGNGPIKQVAVSQFNTCILTVNGDVKCWGERLGLGYGPAVIENIGDDETPDMVGFVPIGEPVKAISAGGGGAPSTCALTQSNKVICWGATTQSGYSQAEHGPFLGDNETPAMVGPHGIAAVNQVSTYGSTCVIEASGTPSVQCFGSDSAVGGAPGSSPFTVNPGGSPEAVTVGNRTGCIHLAGGLIKCWGNNQPGVPGVTSIDAADLAASPTLVLGGPVSQIAHGGQHHCALLESGTVRCWGVGPNGQLGNESTETIGDDEPLLAGGVVSLGGKRATQICEGCALLEDGTVRCWGARGRNSFGDIEDIGDNEPPREVDLGGTAEEIACSNVTTCAVMTGRSALRCWGVNGTGQLGYGTTEGVLGDEPDELPSMLGDVPLGL